MKKFYLRNKNYKTYFKSKIDKTYFHWVIDIKEAKALTKIEANNLLNQIKNKENFEIIAINKEKKGK